MSVKEVANNDIQVKAQEKIQKELEDSAIEVVERELRKQAQADRTIKESKKILTQINKEIKDGTFDAKDYKEKV